MATRVKQLREMNRVQMNTVQMNRVQINRVQINTVNWSANRADVDLTIPVDLCIMRRASDSDDVLVAVVV